MTRKKSVGATNKRKGSDAERYYARRFRQEGFNYCKTSRESSKLHDDCAIDLVFIPVLAQIKAGKQRGMNPSVILSEIHERIAENFPPEAPEHKMPAILIHRKEVGAGNKRTEYHELVTMTFDTFLTFLKAYTNDLQNAKGKN